MAYYRCGPTAVGSRASWGPVAAPVEKAFDRPLSGNFDRIFNAFERTNTFEYAKTPEPEELVIRRTRDLVAADCALAAHAPVPDDDEDFYREKILYSQARQLYPLQEDLADWINKTIGITYLTGENFLDVLDNGVELCQLAAVIQERARDAVDQGLIDGPAPVLRGRCWQRAARRSFFSRDNAENFITFCRHLGVHENLLFESDDLVLHNQPRQVILCLLEAARLAARLGVEPPGLVQLEREIAQEERDSGLDSAGSWQFREDKGAEGLKSIEPPPSSPDLNTSVACVDNADAESTRSEGAASSDSDVPLRPTNELDKRVQLVTRLMERGCNCGDGKCSKLLKVKKVGEGRYNIAGRNVFIRLLKGRHMMVRVGGGWDTLEHFLSRHEPCQVRLVTQGKRGGVLPVNLPADPARLSTASSLASSKTSLSKEPSLAGTASPDGKLSPIERSSKLASPADTGKLSPVAKSPPYSRTSTPLKPSSGRSSRAALTLPLTAIADADPVAKAQQRPRKASAPPTYSPVTPRGQRTPPQEIRSPSASSLYAPKKARSMSLALAPSKLSQPFCGTDRLNQSKARSVSAASTPTTPTAGARKQTRSQSLATTPVGEAKRFGTNVGLTKKTRSMSLAQPTEPRPLTARRASAATVAGAANTALTQAAIEESIRQSLAASIADSGCKKPFLHIKGKYRSPPPREVPPR